MSFSLNRSPLAYMGVRSTTPPQTIIIRDRRPTANDVQNLTIGTFWVIPVQDGVPSSEIWVLVGQAQNQATWIELSTGGDVVPGPQYSLLTSDGSGGFGTGVGPSTAGYVLLAGGVADYPDFIEPTATAPIVVTSNAATLDYGIQISNHSLIVGTGAIGANEIAPSIILGIPLVSRGIAADPEYNTASVAGGGTGTTTFTPYSVICAGTTATGAFQNVSGLGSAGQVLTSNGAGVLPSWQGSGADDIHSINVQVFTASGTYTPTANMVYCIVECLGGGGGAGGIRLTSGGAGLAVSGSGGSGGYGKAIFNAATVGVSQLVTIGAAGAAGVGANPPTDGGTGGTTSFGTLLEATGGTGGLASNDSDSIVSPGGGGTASGNNQVGDLLLITGGSGYYSIANTGGGPQYVVSGAGANSMYGTGGVGTFNAGGGVAFQGQVGVGYGSGGSGAVGFSTLGGFNDVADGGPGAAGICIITEFIS